MPQTAHTSRPAQPPPKRIFVSSTSELDKHRARVARAIERLGQAATRMEAFGALPNAPLPECRKLAAESDAVVVIVAHRYGWVPTAEEGGDGKKSITWHEVDAALNAEVPVIAFLVDEGTTWSHGKEQDRLVDAESDEDSARIGRAVKCLQDFKQFLSQQLVRDTFTTADDLATKVATSLGRWLLESQQTTVMETTHLGHPPDTIDHYLRRLAGETAQLTLLGMGRSLQVELPIAEAYVPLRTTMTRSIEQQETARFKEGRSEYEEDVDLGEAFDKVAQLGQRGVILLGEPGSGKTTGARQFAWQLATRQSLPENLGLPTGMTPVFLRFRNLSRAALAQKNGLRKFLEDETRCDEAPDGLCTPGPVPNGTTCMRGKELGAVAGARKW